MCYIQLPIISNTVACRNFFRLETSYNHTPTDYVIISFFFFCNYLYLPRSKKYESITSLLDNMITYLKLQYE